MNKQPASIAWMARNPVAANLLMMVFLIGGAIVLFTQIKQEVFPEFEIDMVRISVPYPGASPEEVEKGIILAIEEAVRGMDGVKKITSTASEGMGSIYVELNFDADKNKVAADIKNEIDRISSFPADVEEPVVSIPTTRRQVLSLAIYGDLDEKALRELGESVRDDLLKEENITQVELSGVRPLEITVEVSRAQLRAYGLTIDRVAQEIRRSAVELPAGGVKTSGGEILLRTDERRDVGSEFEDITIISTKDGTRVRLGDIARISDGFEEQDVMSFFNGKPSVMLDVFRIGDQTPLEVAKAVKEYRKRLEKELPPGVRTAIRRDRSDIFHQRVDLLKRNAFIGLFLVLGILGLFLEIRLAFWVTMGIPISFFGSFLFLPAADVSINMISLFAFIVTLGMVVDDAIVIGESIYVHRQENKNFIDAAIRGANEVAVPVTFSIFTSVTAFAPMFFVEGTMGKVFRILPAVIIAVLMLSLFESLYILPAHLGHLGKPGNTGFMGRFHRFQQGFGRLMEMTARDIYGPVVQWVVRNRWITFTLGIFLLIVAVGFVKGGRLNITLFPKIESDWIVAEATLPYGVSIDETQKVQKRLEEAVWEVLDKETRSQPDKMCRGVYTIIRGSHQIKVIIMLVPMDQRDISATGFANKWRKAFGNVAGLESLTFDSTAGGPRGGNPIDVMLSHKDTKTLELAASELAGSLEAYAGVSDINDGFSEGKLQLSFTIKPEAQSLGLTAMELGRQIRNNFWGAEALRQQRGRDMIRVMVRLPEAERQSEYDIEELIIRTPGGGEMPLFRAAEIERGTSYTSIFRTDGRRTVNVTADVDQKVTTGEKVSDALLQNELPRLVQHYPGLNYSFEGAQRQGKESVQSLLEGLTMAVLVMYVLIAIPFKSYIQPVVVLSAIPFGFVGAAIGHLIMDYHLSLISLMGLLALSGVVVNDSLVLVHGVNRMRDAGTSLETAVCNAGVRRFRPILLTSLTTFLGLTPMIFETSLQARFLIPMAISLGFGVLFSTFIILLMVPALYIIIEDVRGLVWEIVGDAGRIFRKVRKS
ncbi:efflux RND transporter permease subunit [Desulfococcaceae bacterium HSG8]|nr:efflux RND transporter permease subunit [Desulfococcaceae bacterium HSG8]